MSQSSTIDQARALVASRIADIDEEKGKLERALAELTGNGKKPAAAKKPTLTKTGAGTRKRRKRAGGTRADQAVELITKKPGIGASSIAKEMKIKPNYLYRVLGDLEKEGRVRKDGRHYFPAS